MTASVTYSAPFEHPVRADAAIPIALGPFHRGVNDVVHERGLARAADAGDAREHPKRDLDVNVLEVVFRRAANPHPLHAGLSPHARDRNRELIAQIPRRQ
jgi:hypothetical protein